MPIDQTNQRLLQAFTPQQTTPEPPVTDSQPAVSQPVAPVQPIAPLMPLVPPVESVVPPAAPVIAPDPEPSEIEILERVLAEAEQTVPQAVPTAMLQTVAEATQALNPNPRTGGKETVGAGAKTVVEAGGSTQYVEYEPNPELPPEVEGYLNKTEQYTNQAPPEIVIADITTALPNDRQLPSQPVVVLPITPEVEKIGMTKTPQFSIRWLVEWSHKIMKMFVGNVIYFQKK